MGDPLHRQAIEASRARCRALGLDDERAPSIFLPDNADLRQLHERNARLIQHAAPVMELLREQMVTAHSVIVLSDGHGTIVHSIGDAEFLERAKRVALKPGINWAEGAKGTNAIGTALIDEAPTVVHGAEHFLRANHFLTCSAAPIFDPRGDLLGVLDVTGDQRSYHQHTLGLVKLSARLIENTWFSDSFRAALRLRFHHRADALGTINEGVLALGLDGAVLGANRPATRLLGMSNAALRRLTLERLFDCRPEALLDYFARHPQLPLTLHTADGSVYFALAASSTGAPLSLAPAQRPPPATLPGTSAKPSAPAAVAMPAAPVELPRPTAPAEQRARPVTPAPTVTPDRDEGPPPAACTHANADPFANLPQGDERVRRALDVVRRVAARPGLPLLLIGARGSGRQRLARALHAASPSTAQGRFEIVDLDMLQAEDDGCAGASAEGISANPSARPCAATAHASTPQRGPAASLDAALERIAQAGRGTLLLRGADRLAGQAAQRLARAACMQPQLRLVLLATIAPGDDCAGNDAPRRIGAGWPIELQGLPLRLPSLAERQDRDALLLAAWRHACGDDQGSIGDGAWTLLRRHQWPAGFDELTRVMTIAAAASGAACLQAEHLPDWLHTARAEPPSREAGTPAMANPSAADTPPADQGATTADTTALPLREHHRQAIAAAVQAAGGNIALAARRLGISRNRVYRALGSASSPARPPKAAGR